MTERAILAGFGGQGMMLLGKLCVQAGMESGFEVTFFPSYGAEVRGGTAHCHVIVDDEPIHSPMVETADTVIVMSQQSYEKFRKRLRPDGLLLVNSSMVEPDPAVESEHPAQLVSIPATDLAHELGNVRVANTVMLGAWCALRPILKPEALLSVLDRSLSGAKAHLIEVNRQAFRKGVEQVQTARAR